MSASKDVHRVSDALDLDAIERILATVPDAPSVEQPAQSSFVLPSTVTANGSTAEPTVIESQDTKAEQEKPYTFHPQLGTGETTDDRKVASNSTVPIRSPPANPAVLSRKGDVIPSPMSKFDESPALFSMPPLVQGKRSLVKKPHADEFESAAAQPHCLEVIYSSSCRARDGTPMDHQVLVPRQQTMECSPPTGIAVANEEVVVTHLCYGTRGETLEAQQDSERQDEEPPVPSSALPYHGGVISTKQWNPMCLQMCALFIPLVFFIVIFITQRNTIVTTSSKNILATGDFLASLSAYLVEEQAIASYLTSFATRLGSPTVTDTMNFYVELVAARNQYIAAQNKVNDVIAKIQGEITVHAADLQSAAGDVAITGFLDSFLLATLRARAMTSSQNWDIMMRYENLIDQVLIFRGILLLKESIRTTSELQQTKNIFSTTALYVAKSLTLYFEYLGLGLEMPCPKGVYEVFYLQYVIGTLRVLDRTFLIPSHPEILNTLNKISANDVSILETRLPIDIENVITQMLEYTYQETNEDYYHLELAQELYSQVPLLTTEIEKLNEPLKSSLKKFRTANDYIALVCTLASLSLACIGLAWHATLLLLSCFAGRAFRETNEATLDMRASVIRMHDATMKMTHMDVKEMSNELAVVENKKLKGNNEERELYLGNRTMVELEPYLPLPMVAPPVGAPAESLLYKSAFVRPTLIARRNLVGVRMSFSYLTSTNRDMASMVGSSMSLTKFENSSVQSSHFSPYGSMPSSPKKRDAAERRSRQNFKREVQYFERTTQIIKFAAAVSNEVLTQSERGAYMSVCGEDVVLWINVCEKISNASLLAFVITQSILEYCDRCNLDAPGIALCRGDAVLGNVTSYSPGGPVAANDGEWTQDIIFDPDYDDAICASDLGNTVNSHWKDFVTATEGMTAKRRLKEWLRQLFGVKEKSEKDESSVMDYMESFRGRRWNKKLEEDESDNEFEVDLPKELKEDQKPKESATTVTSFVVYGDVLQEMEMSLEVCRSHGQHVVANEAFVKAFLLDRAKAEEVLEKLSQLRTESKAVHSQAASLFRLPDGTVGSAFSPVMADPKRAQDSVKSAHDASSRPREIVAMVIATLLKAGQQIAPLDMLEVRRRSIVLSVEEVLTAKEKRRREKEAARLARQHHTKEGESGAVDPTGISGMAQRTEPMETSEVDTDRDGPEEPVHTELFSETDDDEAIDGFTALNRCVDVSASVTRVENNQATTSKSQCELHAYYALVLDKSEGVSPASERSFSQSLGSSRAWRLTENPMVVREWDELMRRVVEMYYVAEATSFGQDHSQVESSQLSGLIQGVETLLRKFFNSHPHSVYAKLSTPRILDVVRAVKVMAETAGGLPVGLQQMSPFSLEALLICRLHISTANV